MSKIFVLSGAGLSAESGIKTFRDNNGLWEEYDVMKVCSTEGWQKNRQKVTQFYNSRRQDLKNKEPNKMHFFLSELEKKYPQDFIHLTQNVDDLCERAGSKRVIHLHGTLKDLRCESCELVWNIGYETQNNDGCPRCANQNVRHNVVMFGERAPNYKYIQKAIEACEIFIAIGTSGQVIDIARLAIMVSKSIFVNIKREEYRSSLKGNEWLDDFFTDKIIKPASKSTEDLNQLIERYINESSNF